MTVLFNNFVSGLDKDTECTHSMFAYSTKLDSSVDLLEGRKTLKLDWWAEFNCISTKLHARSCTWIRITMCKDTGRVKSDWNATQYKRTWGVPVNCLLNSSQQCTQDPEKPKNIMAFSEMLWPLWNWLSPCTWFCWEHTWKSMFSTGYLTSRKTSSCLNVPREEQWSC